MILPDKNLVGGYTPKEIALIRAYYILCHAEFEHFLEECATSKINSVLRNYNRNNIPHVLLLSLVFAFIKMDADVLEAKKTSSLSHLINIMRTKYQVNVIDSNQGIKENNLIDIFSPLGIDIYEIMDVTMIGDLNALGSKRGDFAHKGLHFNSVEDVDIARKRTHNIVRALRSFISKLDAA